jgi:hypothetical protein
MRLYSNLVSSYCDVSLSNNNHFLTKSVNFTDLIRKRPCDPFRLTELIDLNVCLYGLFSFVFCNPRLAYR